ncbi:MAG: hypothetical protein PS018_20960 [bacterium]|nr:hypothetical protein [bacterium]
MILFTAPFDFARADVFPPQLTGAWGARAEHQGDDRASVAAKACDSYKQDPKAVAGDVIVFRGSEKLSYGGYADYVDRNISVRQIGPDQWQISDRHYEDGEGGRTVGYRKVTYTVTVSADILTMKEGKSVIRFSRCAERSTQAREDIVPLQRGFYVRADTPCKDASNAALDLFLGKAFRFNCTVKSLQKGANGYRIEQSCEERGRQENYTSFYRILSKTEYIVTSGDGSGALSNHYRYCPQSELPEPWRSNSISR